MGRYHWVWSLEICCQSSCCSLPAAVEALRARQRSPTLNLCQPRRGPAKVRPGHRLSQWRPSLALAALWRQWRGKEGRRPCPLRKAARRGAREALSRMCPAVRRMAGVGSPVLLAPCPHLAVNLVLRRPPRADHLRVQAAWADRAVRPARQQLVLGPSS